MTAELLNLLANKRSESQDRLRANRDAWQHISVTLREAGKRAGHDVSPPASVEQFIASVAAEAERADYISLVGLEQRMISLITKSVGTATDQMRQLCLTRKADSEEKQQKVRDNTPDYREITLDWDSPDLNDILTIMWWTFCIAGVLGLFAPCFAGAIVGPILKAVLPVVGLGDLMRWLDSPGGVGKALAAMGVTAVTFAVLALLIVVLSTLCFTWIGKSRASARLAQTRRGYAQRLAAFEAQYRASDVARRGAEEGALLLGGVSQKVSSCGVHLLAWPWSTSIN